MNCAQCGSVVPAKLDACARCGTPVPPSARAGSADDDATMIRPAGGKVSASDGSGDDATMIRPSGGKASAFDGSGDDATMIRPSGASPPEEDAERTAPGPQTSDPDDPDATLVTPKPVGEHDVTMVAGATGGHESEEGPLMVGLPFGQRYVILKMLGIGGMGAVYQAWDQELGVPVALKVIRIQTDDPLMAEEMGARFKRELLLARDVTHKNVVRIHDLGDFEGMKYFTMSFVKGEDLSSILEEQSRLPIPRALEIFRQVVDGMIAAHEKGIVHRDMKPANIMIDEEGNALLMDFGIARSDSAQGQEAVAAAQIDPEAMKTQETVNLGKTMAGAIVGTLEYMAPEQFQGKVADQRADVYALGLILYDMILGRKRVRSAKSAIHEVKKRIKEPPLSPRTIDESIPEALDELIEKCLSPDPEDRFQSTLELKEALDQLDDEGKPLPKYSMQAKLLAGLAAAVIIAALVGTYFLARGRVITEPEPMTVLVGDFANETGDEAFAGAVEQTLSIALEEAGFISTFPRGNALATAQQLQEGSTLDDTMSRLISRREGIDVMLTGTVEPSGNGYRITAEAFDPTLEPGEGRPLARARARASDRDDVLAAVNEIGIELRRELGDTSTDEAGGADVESVTAASLEAMQAYSEGQELFHQGRLEDAIGAYERAVAEDPAFGRAYAAMGTQYTNLRQLDRAEESYQKALQNLDRMTERERFRTMAAYYLGISRNYEKAIESLEQLVEAYPADRTGHMNLAYASLMTRNFDRAVEEQAIALELDPGSLIQRINYAMYSMYAGHFDVAIDQARGIVAETAGQEGGFANRMQSDAIFTIGRSSAAMGDLSTARSSFTEMKERGLNSDQAVIGEADLAMYRGRPERALEIVDPWLTAYQGENRLDQALDKLVVRAEALLQIGRRDEAIAAASLAAERSELESVLYPAARVLAAAGEREEAEEIAIRLENMLQTQTISYAQLIRGEMALLDGRLLPATEALTDAGQRYDSWFAHLLLGRAYLEAGLGPDALNELVQAVERKGEMTDFFFVDSATLRYWPDALYWLGRAQELLGSEGPARQNYEAFLQIRGDGVESELVEDARVRIAALAQSAA